MHTNPRSAINRRSFLQATTAAAVGGCAALPSLARGGESEQAAASEEQQKPSTVRDHLWIWTHAAGSHNRVYNLPRPSRMTPVEGAHYLGVPNAMFIRYEDAPKPTEFDQYAVAFRSLKRIAWSLTGAGGATDPEERKAVLDLAARYSHIDRFIMDDFFQPDGKGALSPSELEAIRPQLNINGHHHDLWVVLYREQCEANVKDHLAQCDGITYWTWQPPELAHLERDFDQMTKLAPKHKKMLGCYLWDFDQKKPMPLELMKRQSALGLKWLKEGRIEGLIFLGSNVCDLELETVEWARKWIAEVGDDEFSSL